ncbi:MAG: SgcJ/EcaC family oxidoreductase [Gammaproteobacteria bacterium]|nr:SgcJ/EcaC family oxidoreductase [Gammaproteobacteria bacterium]
MSISFFVQYFFVLTLDRAVDRLYRKSDFNSERERMEHLFTLYSKQPKRLIYMKFRHNAVKTVLFVFLPLLFSNHALADEAADIAAIEQAAQRWIELYTTGDLDRLMTLYTEDAIVALHGRPALRGAEQVRNFFAPGMGKSRVTFEIDIEEIQVHGDTAHLLSKYYLTAEPKDGGDVYRDAGRSLLIYKRNADNEWKLYLDIDQATPDARF